MARKRKRIKRKVRNFRRLFIAGAWCLLVLCVLFFVAKCALRNKIEGLRLEHQDDLRNRLEQVKLPQGTANEIIAYRGFTVCFNKELHIPNCTVYELTGTETNGTIDRVGNFEADSAVAGCARPWDYTLSGYERGHMVPVGDLKWDARAMMHSFKMTNVCPQRKSLNQGGWNRLEEKVREWARRDSALIVVTGPVVTNDMERMGKGRVAVPKHFFKVILAPFGKKMRAIGFIYPNGSAGKSLKHYAVSVDHVEHITGYDFFDALPNEIERDIESRHNLDQWLH